MKSINTILSTILLVAILSSYSTVAFAGRDGVPGRRSGAGSRAVPVVVT